MSRAAKALILVGLAIVVANVALAMLIKFRIGDTVFEGRFGMGLIPAAAAAILCGIGAVKAAIRRAWFPWATLGFAGFAFASVAFVVAAVRMSQAAGAAYDGIRKAKTSEAKANLGAIGNLAENYFLMSGEMGVYSAVPVVPVEGPSRIVYRFPTNERVSGPCDAPNCNAECVPRDFASVKGGKYEPSEDDWLVAGGNGEATAWSDLRFSTTEPIRFQYCWSAHGEDDEAVFTAVAFGDLDGDGEPSEFRREGRASGGEPTVGPLFIRNEFE